MLKPFLFACIWAAFTTSVTWLVFMIPTSQFDALVLIAFIAAWAWITIKVTYWFADRDE